MSTSSPKPEPDYEAHRKFLRELGTLLLRERAKLPDPDDPVAHRRLLRKFFREIDRAYAMARKGRRAVHA
jgi:hypothetical protein